MVSCRKFIIYNYNFIDYEFKIKMNKYQQKKFLFDTHKTVLFKQVFKYWIKKYTIRMFLIMKLSIQNLRKLQYVIL